VASISDRENPDISSGFISNRLIYNDIWSTDKADRPSRTAAPICRCGEDGDSLRKHFYISVAHQLFGEPEPNVGKTGFSDTDLISKHLSVTKDWNFSQLVAKEYMCWRVVAPTKQRRHEQKDRPNAQSIRPSASNLRNKKFPDLIMIWIGHNNLDWVEGFRRRHGTPDTLQKRNAVRQNYTEPLQTDRSRKNGESQVAIVVSDWESRHILNAAKAKALPRGPASSVFRKRQCSFE